MVLKPGAIKTSLRDCGYRPGLLRTDVVFGDARPVPLVGFSQYPTDVRSACVAVLADSPNLRCVYCLERERWAGCSASFHLEHFIPTVVEPSGKCVYANLLYACATCNTAKSDILGIPNPCQVAFGKCLSIESDGTIRALNEEGEKLRDVLRLNRPKDVEHRARWMRTLAALKESHPELYVEFMSFPSELPDLRPPKKCPPRNSKPQGARECFFALQERGTLPATY